ncbi:MAG: hypothetical protein HYS57_01105 [Parcubacteria group bacterium]|nr:hypothetical protein [Parcubacteria group bacterium]
MFGGEEEKGGRPSSAPLSSVTRPTWETKCTNCGKITKVPFEPDPKRPVYCEDCLKVKRQQQGDGGTPRREEGREEGPLKSIQVLPPQPQGRNLRSEPVVRSVQAKPMSLADLPKENQEARDARPLPPRPPGEKTKADRDGLKAALEEALGEKKE